LNNDILRTIPIESRFDAFNKKAVNVLNSIIEKLMLKLSLLLIGEKWATLEEMQELYKHYGVIKSPKFLLLL